MKQVLTGIIPVIIYILHTANLKALEEDSRIIDCPSRFVKIEGSTNLNAFELVYSFEDEPVEFSVSSGNSSGKYKKLVIPVEKFRGESKAMERDFHELVKYDKHPEIIIEFNGFSNIENEPDNITTNVRITMAGTSHSYTVPVELKETDSGNICLNGKKSIQISDFKLDPPVKYFGIIRVEDQINIDFSIDLSSERPVSLLLLSK